MHSPLVMTFVAVAAHLVGASLQGSADVITGPTNDAAKTWKANEEERVPPQVEEIAEKIVSAGSKGVTKPSNRALRGEVQPGLQDLKDFWHGQGVPSDEISERLNVPVDKKVFESDGYAKLKEHVKTFNEGKPRPLQVSAIAILLSKKLEGTKTTEGKKQLAAPLYSLLQKLRKEGHGGNDGFDGEAYLSKFIF